MLVIMAAAAAADDPACAKLELAVEEYHTLIQVMEAVEAAAPHLRASMGSEVPSERLTRELRRVEAFREARCP